jgi:hypothetical protein
VTVRVTESSWFELLFGIEFRLVKSRSQGSCSMPPSTSHAHTGQFVTTSKLVRSTS